MRRIFQIFLPLAFVVGLVACNESDSATPVNEVVAPAPPPRTYSLAEWNSKFNALFDKSSEKNEDGVSEFSACFERQPESSKCKFFAFGKRDAFKKVTAFQPTWSAMEQIGRINSFVLSHIYVPDCRMPGIALRPRFMGDSWIFINSMSVLADGAVVFEKELEHVDRDTLVRGRVEVMEVGGFVLTAEDINALRSITKAKDVVIRLGGKKGYVTLKKKEVNSVIHDWNTMLGIYDLLTSALVDVSSADCT